MGSTEPFPDLDEVIDFHLFQEEDDEIVLMGENLRPASHGETRHLRHRLRQLTASCARESRFTKALVTAEANGGVPEEEVKYRKQQALWAARDFKRQKDLMREDHLVQRYEASNPSDPLGLRANASSWKINWKHENGEPRRGESWNNYFTRERKRAIDSWTPILPPADTEDEIMRQKELDDQYEYSERQLGAFRLEKQNARRRATQEYPSNVVAAEQRRHERQAQAAISNVGEGGTTAKVKAALVEAVATLESVPETKAVASKEA